MASSDEEPQAQQARRAPGTQPEQLGEGEMSMDALLQSKKPGKTKSQEGNMTKADLDAMTPEERAAHEAKGRGEGDLDGIRVREERGEYEAKGILGFCLGDK